MQKKYRLLWMKRGMIHLSLLLLLLLLVMASTALALTFTDGDFTDPDWTLTAKTRSGWIMGEVSSQQQATGGVANSPYLKITTKTDSGELVTGYFIWSDAAYNPQTQGAIASVDYSEYRKQISGGGSNQATGVALLQGTTFYWANGNYTNVTDWTQLSFTGLTAQSFYNEENNNLHPDFTNSGAPIYFGFYRHNSNSGTQIAGIDNWSVTVNPVPLPPSALLLGSGLAGLLAVRGWRLRRRG